MIPRRVPARRRVTPRGRQAVTSLGRRRVTSLFGVESRPRAGAATRRSSGPFAGGGRASRGGRDVLTQFEPAVTHIDPSRSGEGLRAPAGGPARPAPHIANGHSSPIVTCPSLHQDISEPTPAGGQNAFHLPFVTLPCPSLVPLSSLTRPSLPSHSRPRTTPVLAPADPLPFVDPLPPVPLQPACAPRRPPPPPPPSPVLTTTHETDSKFRVLVLLENWVRSASAVICMRLFAVSGPSIA